MNAQSASKILLSCGLWSVTSLARIDVSMRHVDGSSIYVGFDPTADSLHIGNLVAVMAMLHFQRAGYQPLAVVSA